ncbi:MAG: DNA polymerase III subunit gamma/tau [Patescibacteria group bacterium]
MALYRTYRPQTFSSVVGQDHVKQTLRNALTHDLVAHAYLFSGPRGNGKTSIARILAMAVNCSNRSAEGEPCGTCQSCEGIRGGRSLAVVEIDAASNRGIDEIRTLRETIALSPGAGAVKKVYIIDEVHMLTKEAFNALLKTLEEPPAHAIFILATTELHKVPETIISRVQHFELRRATPANIRAHLTWVAKQEKLKIDEAAVELLALHADGALRDALSLLGQLQAMGEPSITVETVRQALGVAPEAELVALIHASLSDDGAAVHTSLAQFAERGYDTGALINDLILLFRTVLWQRYNAAQAPESFEPIIALQVPVATLVVRIEALLKAKQQLRWSPLPLLPVELALLPADGQPPAPVPIAPAPVAAEPAVSAPVVVPAPIPPAPDPQPVTPPPAVEPVPAAPPPEPTPMPVPPLDPSADLGDIWKQAVAAMQPKNASLAALLKASNLQAVAAGEVVIGVPFSFYADRIVDRKNATMLLEILGAHGVTGTVRCELAATAAAPPPPVAAQQPATLPDHGRPPLLTRTPVELEQDVRDVFEVGA